MTAPFADFTSEAVARLALSRTYSSADASIRLNREPGAFGPGWRHDWESELTCRSDSDTWGPGNYVSCRVSRGLAAASRFTWHGGATATGAYAGEQWTLLHRADLDLDGAGDRSILVRRPDDPAGQPRWILFLADGRELHYATVCDCPGSSDKYCTSPLQGGKARLVKVVDPRGNAVAVSYDRQAGVVLALSDGLGHSLELRRSRSDEAPLSACADSRSAVLEYDGTVYASYSYLNGQLRSVALGRDGPVLQTYEYDGSRPSYLTAVKNAAGDPIVEFGYDANGWAAHIRDRSTTADVSYDPTLASTRTIQISAKGSSASSKSQTRGGHSGVVQNGSTQYGWLVQKYLRCREDAAHRVHWYDRDNNYRIVRHREFAAGVLSCAAASADQAVPELDESFEYGLAKPIAEGVAVDLTTVTKVSRRSRLADQLSNSGSSTAFDRVYDYDSQSKPWDPSGYACTIAALPVGSVLCRYVEDGLTKDINGVPVREQRATFYSYDAHGRVTKRIGPMKVGYSSDPGIPVEERTYWSDTESAARRGRLHEVKRYVGGAASPLVTSYDWDTFGPYQIVDPNGRITLLVHDSRGRIVARAAPDGRSLGVRYYDDRSPRLVVFNDGSSVRYQYDDKGRVRAVQPFAGDPEADAALVAGWTGSVTYDPAGNTSVVSLADANAIVRWLRLQQHDADHKLLAEIHPEGLGISSWGYDPSGILTMYADEEGKTTQVELDGIGRPKTVRRTGPGSPGVVPPIELATYSFDAGAGSLRSVTGSRGVVAVYETDDFGGVLSVANDNTFIRSPWRYTYDARGAVVRRSNGVASTTYSYDGAGRLTQFAALNQTNGEQIQYVYQYDRAGDLGRLASIEEARRATEFAYDEVGRVLSETVRETGISAPLTTSYTWDANGHLGTLAYPSGLQVRFDRDPATKTVTEVKNVGTGTAYASQVTWWPNGPLRAATLGNGLEILQSYNLRYEPRSISSGPVALGYEPTPAGNVGAITSGAVRSAYGYDLLDRLVAFSPGRTSDARALRYEYAGDRVIAARTYGPPDTLVYAFGYDDQSNLSAISVYDTTGTTIVQTVCLKHDALGRLVTFGRTLPSSGGPDRVACRDEAEITEVIARFEYDARNRRVARYTASTGSTTEFAFLPDGRVLAELTRPSSAGEAWAAARDYVWLESTPLVQVERAFDGPNGRPYYFHVDHLGLPRALTDPNGQIAWRADARPYGDVVEEAGSAVVTNLRLPGQYDERLFAAAGISGMQGPYYNWNRWYLPSVGRYMELDPIALRGEFNSPFSPDWYNYAGANPLRRTDRTGRTWWDDWFGDYPAKFKDWYHRQWKTGRGNGSQEDIEEAYDEWKRQGEPGPDNKGKYRGPRPPIPPIDPWDEVLPLFFIDPCLLFPEMPMCHRDRSDWQGKDPNFCSR